MSAKNNVKSLFIGFGLAGWGSLSAGGVGFAAALILGTVATPLAVGLIWSGIAALTLTSVAAASLFKGVKTDEAKEPVAPWVAAGTAAAAVGVLSLAFAFSHALENFKKAPTPQALSQVFQGASTDAVRAGAPREDTALAGGKTKLPGTLSIAG